MAKSLSVSCTVFGDSKFCEGNLVMLDEASPDFETDEYDYESDSDLGYLSEDELEDDSRTHDRGYGNMKENKQGYQSSVDTGLSTLVVISRRLYNIFRV